MVKICVKVRGPFRTEPSGSPGAAQVRSALISPHSSRFFPINISSFSHANQQLYLHANCHQKQLRQRGTSGHLCRLRSAKLERKAASSPAQSGRGAPGSGCGSRTNSAQKSRRRGDASRPRPRAHTLLLLLLGACLRSSVRTNWGSPTFPS